MIPSSLFAPSSKGTVIEGLLAAAWADGEVQPYEVDVILGAVMALSPVTPRARVLHELRCRCSSALPSLDGITAGERHVAFALAAWVIVADGRETEEEFRFLEGFRRVAGLDKEVAAKLLSMARWVQRCRPASVSAYEATAVLLTECLNVLARVDGPWPPERDPFERQRRRLARVSQ